MEDFSRTLIEYAQKKGAEYADIRIQTIENTLVDVRDGMVVDCVSGVNSGAGIRVIADGSWGFSSTTLVDDGHLRMEVESAVSAAKAKGRKKNPVVLADSKTVSDRVPLKVVEDPREVSLDEKCDFMRGLNKTIGGFDERIVNVRTQLTDAVESLVFRNSEGTYIEMDHPVIETNFWVTSREGGVSQWARNRLAGAKGFEFVREEDLEEQGRDAVQRSIDLLKGKPTPTGRQTVIMDPCALGVFIHEAFGHANEADSVVQRRSFLWGLIGEQIASEHVTMISDPTVEGAVGSYPYDDEGTPGVKTTLIDDGVFKSYMHSRETAADLGSTPTGNARAQDFSLPPIVRMNNLCMEPGTWTLNEIIEDTKYGILIEGSRGGMEDPERGGFQFSAQNCYLVERGEVVGPLKDVSISGMTIEVFKSIDAVADNYYLHPGHCGKGEPGVMQSKHVTDGGPYIRVADILVGGTE